MHDTPYDTEHAAKLARREQPTPLELIEQLAQGLDRLETMLNRLGERLEPILVERAPSPALVGEPAPGRTLLSARLTHLAAYAERLGEQANELHARVEL